MISPTVVYGTAAAVYLVTLAAFLLRRAQIPARFRRSYRLVVLVLATGVLTSLMLATDVGVVPLSEATGLPGFLNDGLAYPLLWYVAARLGGASRRLTAVVTVFPFVQVVAFQFGASAGGLVGLLSSLVVIGGHGFLAYLFWGPIWRGAQSLPEERRLLHWKTRNLLLFLIGMLIVFAFLSLVGAFTQWASLVLNQYVSLLIRVGVAGFLLVNLGALSDSEPLAADEVGATSATNAADAAAGD
jgi:sensory rhodopsin